MPKFQPKNEAEWLDFRRTKLTSTNLRDLHLYKTAANWNRIRAEKEGEKVPGFPDHVLEAMEWGTAREPLLAPVAQAVDSRLIYNADPQTIGTDKTDPRLSCTPDLYSDGDVIGEIKTSKKPFTGGRYHDWCPDGYYLQVQQNMKIMGAEACVLVLEQHQDYDPLPPVTRVIEYDRDVVNELAETAEEWFAWLDSTNPDWMGDTDPELEALVDEYAGIEAEIKHLNSQRADVRQEIFDRAGGSIDTEIGRWKLTISKPVTSNRFDSKAFRKDHPALHAEYQKETTGAPRLTVKEL